MKKIAIIKWIIDRTDGGLKVAVDLSNELSENYEVILRDINVRMINPKF